MLSGAPGGSWVYVLRPAGRRFSAGERGRAGAGDYRRPVPGRLVELGRGSEAWPVEPGDACRWTAPGVSPYPPPPWYRLPFPVKVAGLPWPGATVRDRDELLRLASAAPLLPGADWHDLCHAPPPPAY